MNKCELLAPAGSGEALEAAIDSGADAVYLGVKNFNARLRSTNFSYAALQGALKSVHKTGKKIYTAVNTVFCEREADRVFQLLKFLNEVGVDGIIVQDLGILNMVETYFSNLKIHASTQMNISTSQACNFLSKHKVSRAVLPRELSFEDIKSVRSGTNLELEVFVHGSLCISASGLCLFSSFLGGKSANRGMCTQACRRVYRSVSDDKYYFSPKDLQLLDAVPALFYSGINALKIEGRMKSAEYAGAVTSAYRLVLDALLEGKSDSDVIQSINRAKEILKNDFAREKTFFHFSGDTDAEYLNAEQAGGTGIALGAIIKTKNFSDGIEGEGACSLAYLVHTEGVRAAAGDSVRLHKKNDSRRETHKIKTVIKGEGGGYYIDVPHGFGTGDSVYLIETKSRVHYRHIIPADLSAFKKTPGFDKVPFARFTKRKLTLKSGIYVSVENIEDMYIAQSKKGAFLILNGKLSNIKKIIASLSAKTALPFKSCDTIINLPPFLREGNFAGFKKDLPVLQEAGYTKYILNNIAYMSLLDRQKCVMIAGEYLYAFNRYAASFLFEAGFCGIVNAPENSRQNSEKVFIQHERDNVFIKVYSHPALFRIQDNLKNIYKWQKFSDSRGEEYILHCESESVVTSVKPFAITDKVRFLQEAGFKRFIIDFCHFPLNKKNYKEVFDAAENAKLIPGTSRFNWKNGFFSNEGQPRTD